jgi:hypothetical protein
MVLEIKGEIVKLEYDCLASFLRQELRKHPVSKSPLLPLFNDLESKKK